MNTILQVPIDKNLRNQAASVAEKMGFSSLQEVIRLFVNKIAIGEINVAFENTIQLSPKAIKRYNKITDDFKKGRNIYTTNNIDDLIKHLNEDSLS